jgi:hypothetical protein
MEQLIFILMLLVGLNFVLKLTHHGPVGILLTALFVAAFVGLSCDAATEQSRTQIADWLADTDLMLDLAVVLTVDVVLHTGLYLLLAQRQYRAPMKRATRWLCVGLQWFPGLLIFPTLFSLLVSVIFLLPGADFGMVAWTLAATVFVVSAGLGFAFRWLLPEPELRLEVGFLLSCLIACIGVVATVNGRTAVQASGEVDLRTLGGVVAVLALGASVGYFGYLRKARKS